MSIEQYIFIIGVIFLLVGIFLREIFLLIIGIIIIIYILFKNRSDLKTFFESFF